MPFIISRTNRSISREQEQQLKSRLGRAIELVPGKSEQYLMLGFEDNCHLWLRGDNSQPVAYIEAAIWGNEAHLGYDKFTAEVTRIFNEVLGIAPDCIYIRYSDIPDWGVDGMNFDRNNTLPEVTTESLRELISRHPLISPIEISQAFNLHTADEVKQFIQPLIDSGEIILKEVPHGLFIEKNNKEENEDII